MALLDFVDIKKSFGSNEVLSGVSFSIKSGDIFGLVSESAGGKSTLLKILVGMFKANNGKIFFNNVDAIKNINYLRRKIGFATQQNMLFDELSVYENSYYFGKLYGMRRKDILSRFKELVDLLKLNGFEKVQIKDLSGGTQKRANILVSLIHSPQLLVLDEPTAGLDPLLREIVWSYIRKINEAGTTIFVTSHLLGEIEKNCNIVCVLKKGRVVGTGSVPEYKEGLGEGVSFEDIFRSIMKDESI